MSRPSRLTRIVFAAVAAAVSALITIVVVTLAADAPPSTEAKAKVQAPAATTRSTWRAKDIAFVPESDAAVAQPTREPRLGPRDPDDVPKPSEIDRQYPGFAKAYDDAFASAQARGWARTERRCLTALPESVKEVRWDTIETFDPLGSSGKMARTTVEYVPSTEEQAPFTKCLAAATQSPLLIDLPEGTSVGATIEVHNAGIVYINDYTDEYLAQEVETLRQRVADPSIGDDRRAMLQDHLELWECYLHFGMSRRRECLSR